MTSPAQTPNLATWDAWIDRLRSCDDAELDTLLTGGGPALVLPIRLAFRTVQGCDQGEHNVAGTVGRQSQS